MTEEEKKNDELIWKQNKLFQGVDNEDSEEDDEFDAA